MVIGLVLPQILTYIIVFNSDVNTRANLNWMYALLIDPFWDLGSSLSYVLLYQFLLQLKEQNPKMNIDPDKYLEGFLKP